jgi:L-iditol 2-dehydrogenase
MKTASVKAPFQFRIDDVPLRDISEDELLVKVRACGVCGTDLATAATEAKDWQPFGHEIAGVVEAAGSRASNVSKGDSVVLESGTYCRYCSDCRNGRVDLCNNGPNYWLKGPMGFSEYVIAPKEMAIAFSGIGFDEAALVEPLGVAIDLVKTADVQLGDDVLVVGAGPIGIMAVKLARLRGARRIWVAARSHSRRRIELARAFGADEVVLTDRADFAAGPYPRGGLDRVLVTAPPSLLPAAMDAARVGGVVAFIGIEWGGGARVSFDANAFHFKKLQLRASFAGPALYFPMALDLIASGAIDAKSLVSSRFGLEGIADAMRDLRDDKAGAVKGVMVDA